MSYYFGPTQNYVSTSLNGSINDSVDTITVNDASKLKFPGYVVIDREDGNGTATSNAREVVYYTGISGNDLTGCQRGADGSANRSHSSGALVEAVLTTGMWNSLVTAVGASLNEGGTGLHVSTATIPTSLNVSGASVIGIPRGMLFQVPGSLASQANIGGMIVVPGYMTAASMIGYVQTPSSIASVSAFILKQGGTVVGMLGIAGAATYGSSASLAVTALVPGDNLTLSIRSTASLASDLSVVLRTA
jgi:hypothetical protein